METCLEIPQERRQTIRNHSPNSLTTGKSLPRCISSASATWTSPWTLSLWLVSWPDPPTFSHFRPLSPSSLCAAPLPRRLSERPSDRSPRSPLTFYRTSNSKAGSLCRSLARSYASLDVIAPWRICPPRFLPDSPRKLSLCGISLLNYQAKIVQEHGVFSIHRGRELIPERTLRCYCFV